MSEKIESISIEPNGDSSSFTEKIPNKCRIGKLDTKRYTQRYTYRVLQTIQMKLIFLCVWAEQAVSRVLGILYNFAVIEELI